MELDGADLAGLAVTDPIPERLSVLFDPAPLVVHGGAVGPELGSWLRGVPTVTVYVGDPGWTPAGFDIYLTEVADAPAPWVRAPLAAVVGAVERQPLVSLSAAALLRASDGADVWAGLAAESSVYAALLASAPFRGWRAARPPGPQPVQSEPPVLVRRDDRRLRIVLNRPARHNAVDTAMRDALVDALALAALDPDIDLVELAGSGPSFCSGGDLEEFGTVGEPAVAHVVRLTRHPGRWMSLVGDRVVVRAHGACVGAGAELAAFAGRVVATPDAFFALPETGMGLVPGAGGTVSIPRRVGSPRAAWLMITGARIDAETARAWHLVDEVAG